MWHSASHQERFEVECLGVRVRGLRVKGLGLRVLCVCFFFFFWPGFGDSCVWRFSFEGLGFRAFLATIVPLKQIEYRV